MSTQHNPNINRVIVWKQHENQMKYKQEYEFLVKAERKGVKERCERKVWEERAVLRSKPVKGLSHYKIDLSWIDLRSISVRFEKVFTLI